MAMWSLPGVDVGARRRIMYFEGTVDEEGGVLGFGGRWWMRIWGVGGRGGRG